MRTVRTACGRLALAVALALGAAACDGGTPQDAPGHGVVVEVDAASRQITLDHGDIPGLMKAMTMTFHVAPDVDLDAIARGDEVDFRAREERGMYTVTAIEPSGS